jgi:pimeloyl-ACP methyl ester carboxylesterase
MFDPHVRIEGNGDTVMLVPGLDGTGLLFYRQVASLARRHRVITARLREDASSMDQLVADLAALQEQAADGAPVTLIGESFGGLLSLAFALAHPTRVRELVLLNSFPHFTPQVRLWAGYCALRAIPWGMMATVRRLTSASMHSRHTHRRELDEFHVRMRATTRAGYLSRLRMLRGYDIRDRLPEIRVRTLLLAADRDRLVPAVQQARLMASRLPDACVRVLEGHGHICLLAPDLDLAALLEEWRCTPRIPFPG